VALLNAETKIPQLLLDYVDSRRTALSIPTSAELPFYAGVIDGDRAMPCVVFYCSDFSMKHPERMQLTISVDYLNQTAIEDSTEESAIASQVRSAVADVESWKTWLLALSEANRTGWRIIKTRVTGGGIDIDAEKSQRRRFTTIQISAITSETTFPV
jgi:hypothetical protein